METIVDESLVGRVEVYFETGDLEELIRVAGEQFLRIMNKTWIGRFSQRDTEFYSCLDYRLLLKKSRTGVTHAFYKHRTHHGATFFSFRCPLFFD